MIIQGHIKATVGLGAVAKMRTTDKLLEDALCASFKKDYLQWQYEQQTILMCN